MLFMAFHGEPRFDAAHPPHESPAVVTVPLLLLAIPSIASGWLVGPVVFGDFFGRSLVLEHGEEYHGLWRFIGHGLTGLPFWLAMAGLALAWFLYRKRTDLPKKVAMAFGPLYAIVDRKFGFDELYGVLFAGGARLIGRGLLRGGDQTLIDGLMVNGTARVVGWFSTVVRLLQTGLVNTYAFLMLFGVLIGVSWIMWRLF
jgi:NADH-quinone oxidoreductase subunit L